MHFSKKSSWTVAIVATCGLLFTATAGAKAANILIENVTVIDGTGRAPMTGASVLVKGDRISVVSPSRIAHDAGVEVVDGSGKFLIPGLIDTHIHLQDTMTPDGKHTFDHHMGLTALHSYLYSGVTAVFDAGNEADYIFPIRDDERSGKIVSPRIFATGSVITVPHGYGDGNHSFAIADWNVSRPILDAYFKQRKPDLQKVLIDRHGVFVPLNPSPSVDILKNVVRLANENGIRTTVHAASEEDYNDALEGGIDNFAHVVRFPATDALIKRVSTRRLVMTTTLAVHDYIIRLVADPSFLDSPLFKATVDPKILEEQKTTERKKFAVPGGLAAQSAFFEPIVAANIKKIYDAGGILAAGTDRTWGPTLHMELELLHTKAGIPLLDVIKIGTLNAAMYLGKENEFGSIERGKLADMVLLTADPTQDVKNLQAIAAVYKGGEKINLAALDIPINAKPASAPRKR